MTTCRHCRAEIHMRDFAWFSAAGIICWSRTEIIEAGYDSDELPAHEPLPATPVEEQLGWLGVYAGPPQGWSR